MVNMPSTYEDDSSSGSDYDVEQFVPAKRVRRTVNDDSADLLGNFDDAKRKEILEGTYKDPEESEKGSASDTDADDSSVAEDDEQQEEQTGEEAAPLSGEEAAPLSGEEAALLSGAATDSDTDTEAEQQEDAASSEVNNSLTTEQLASLLRGSSKANRHVLYVTNLNFDTAKEDLMAHFGAAGVVKSVRIPRQRRGGFAFVEMADMAGFQSGFKLHDTELMGRRIKVQISEAGKKKSANKKNIMKQKNRKLAEMRNEQKTFTKSGKFYDKTLKKEKAKEMLARKRWRKHPAPPKS